MTSLTLFNRALSDRAGPVAPDLLERIKNALEALRNSDDHEHVAMAENLRYDHRVSEAREQKLLHVLASLPASCDPGLIEKALTAYFDEFVRFSDTPEFADARANAPNLFRAGADHPELPGDQELVNVMNLTGLFKGLWPFRHRAAGVLGDLVVEFEGRKDLVTEKESFFDRYMTDESRRRGLILELLKLRGQLLTSSPFEPTWATRREAFEVLTEGSKRPERWAEVVGVPYRPGWWFVLLHYRAEEVMEFARPTILDTGWNARHHHSPRHDDAKHRGHAVDLQNPRAKEPAPCPLPEYIHRSIVFTEVHVDLPSVAKTRQRPSLALGPQRNCHRDRLRKHYNGGVEP